MTEQRDPATSGEPVDSDPRTGASVPPTDREGVLPPPPGVPGDVDADVSRSDPARSEPMPPTAFGDPQTSAGAGDAGPPGTPASADPAPENAAVAGDRSTGSTARTVPAAGPTPTETPEETTAPTTPVNDDELDREAERIAARAAERAERNRALGKVERPAPEPPPVVLTTQVRTTDKWHGALGLFVLRLVLGAVMFIHGVQHLTSIGDTQQFVDQSTVLPYPDILGWVLGIGEVLIAVALIFGFLVRVAGVGAMAIGIMALVFVLWGTSNPFQPDVPGFLGELELLIVAIGFLFLLVGGGRWGVDGALRKRRRLKKEAAANTQ